ncbi:MAG: TVP38/TMEM64 family protein [Acidobacteriota bacterium]
MSPANGGDKAKTAHIVLHVVLLAVFLGLIAWASVELSPRAARMMKHPEEFRTFLDSYGAASALIFILVQAIQVVVFVIPGEIVQVAGGFIFGSWLGTLYSVAGILLGTMIAFFAARLFGFSLVRAIISPGKLARFEFLINNPKSEIAMFALFLVPGIPKDSLVYIAGVTPIKPLRFFLVSMIARFPALWGSTYIGANLQEKDYLPVWILSGVSLVLFIAGVLNRDRLIAWLHRLRRRGEGPPPEG